MSTAKVTHFFTRRAEYVVDNGTCVLESHPMANDEPNVLAEIAVGPERVKFRWKSGHVLTRVLAPGDSWLVSKESYDISFLYRPHAQQIQRIASDALDEERNPVRLEMTEDFFYKLAGRRPGHHSWTYEGVPILVREDGPPVQAIGDNGQRQPKP